MRDSRMRRAARHATKPDTNAMPTNAGKLESTPNKARNANKTTNNTVEPNAEEISDARSRTKSG